MTDYIVIGELEVKTSDEKNTLTWHEAMKGFSDGWRLPTKEELNVLYQHKDVVGGFANFFYWSSTEYSSTNAWYQSFNFGVLNNGAKTATCLVRAVRAVRACY